MIPTVSKTKCRICGAEPKEVLLSDALGQDIPGTTLVPSCMCWQGRESEEHLKALRQHKTQTAFERFVRLGFGNPRDLKAGIIITKDLAWCYPVKAAAEHKHLLVYGNKGNGKSTTVYRVAWALCLSGLRPRGGYVPSLVNDFRGDEGHDEVTHVRDGDFLILDDIDKLRGTEYQMEVFCGIVDHYNSRGLPILSTMNIHPSTFPGRLIQNGVTKDAAESLESRIMHNAEVIQASGPDFRKQEA